MAKLFLLRHLKSQWNKENKFTGWTDVEISQDGLEALPEVALQMAGEKIDSVYTSPLKRNSQTASLLLEKLGLENLPVLADKALDERNYGEITGMDKDQVKAKFGEKQVQLWRRSWDIAPPQGESLKDVYKRAVPFFQEHAEKDLKDGKNVLVVASHNSLRAVVKYIEAIADEEIINLELPFGALVKYEFDGIKYKKL